MLGLETSLGKILPGAYDPANALSTSTKTSQDGSGAVNRQEKIQTSIAVNVVFSSVSACSPMSCVAIDVQAPAHELNRFHRCGVLTRSSASAETSATN